MPSIAELMTPLALGLPMLGLGSVPGNLAQVPSNPVIAVSSSSVGATIAAETAEVPAGEQAEPVMPQPAANSLDAIYEDMRAGQIRIERRVIVRISPQGGTSRQTLLAQLPQRAVNTRYEERKADKCLPVERIAGVQTGSGNRLLLFLQDSKIISLNLEKACRARDFYSGFYVERAADGKLCVDRDKLQSRNGARCEIDSMMQLVALKD